MLMLNKMHGPRLWTYWTGSLGQGLEICNPSCLLDDFYSHWNLRTEYTRQRGSKLQANKICKIRISPRNRVHKNVITNLHRGNKPSIIPLVILIELSFNMFLRLWTFTCYLKGQYIVNYCDYCIGFRNYFNFTCLSWRLWLVIRDNTDCLGSTPRSNS